MTKGMQTVVRGTVTAVLFMGLLSAPGQSQDAGVPTTDRELVTIDVVVRNDAGRVSGLSTADFEIFDNGIRQEIVFFEQVAGEADLANAVSLPPNVASNRRDWRGAVPASATVILIDRVNTSADAQVYANQRLLEFLESFDRTEGLALYELRSDGLRVLHDFANSPAELLEAAAGLEPEHSLLLESSASVGGFESGLGNIGLDPIIAESQTGNSGFGRRSADYFLNDRAQRTSAALETITRHLKGLPGRRNVVWLSGRFPFAFDPWSRSDLVDEVETSTIQQIASIGGVINEANVAIYPVDVRGPGGEGAEIQGVAEQIAHETGGRRFRTNALGEAIASAVNDAEVIYTLGFYPSEVEDDPNRRSLRVEIANGNDFDVLYRPSYLGPGTTEEAAPRVGLAELMTSPLDATEIGLSGLVAPLENGQGQLELVILVDVADLELIESEGRRQGTIDVGIMFRANDDGTSYVMPRATFPIDLTEEQYDAFSETGLIVQRILNTEGRAGMMRVIVQDTASGAAGSFWVPAGTN